jgi:hypothetical protein
MKGNRTREEQYIADIQAEEREERIDDEIARKMSGMKARIE